MEPLREVIATLSRSHVLLTFSSLAVLVVAVPTGPDLDRGLDQLRLLVEVFGEDGYDQRCADRAAELYEVIWRDVVTAGREASLAIEPDRVRFGGFADCQEPEPGATLEEYVAALTQGEDFDIANVSPQEVVKVLERLAAPGWSLQMVGIRFPGELGGLRTVRAPGASDSINIELIQRPPGEYRLRVALDDSLVLRAAYLSSADGRIRVWNEDVPGSMGGRSYSDEMNPLLWLSSTDWGFHSLADSIRGQQVVLPALQPFWEEIGTLTVPEAVRYLQARADERRGSVEVLGLDVDASVVGWVGPMFLLFVLVYLYAHLQQAERLLVEAPRSHHSWVGLFPGLASAAVRVVSLVVLPSLASGLIAVRAAEASSFAGWSAWGAAGGCLLLGLVVLAKLHRLVVRMGAGVTAL